MSERTRYGNFVKLTGYITPEGFAETHYSLEQISRGKREDDRVIVNARTTKDLGKMLATDPKLAKVKDLTLGLRLLPCQDGLVVDTDDTEYEDNKFGYRFERPANLRELTEIAREYAKKMTPTF